MLAEISDGVHSVAEADARRLVRRSSLPRPQWNVPIVARGATVAVVDAWFDDVGLAWEIDSYAFHLSPQQYARTLERHAGLTAHGVVVLHTLPTRIRRQPGQVLAELRAAYAHAAARPRPQVHVSPRP